VTSGRSGNPARSEGWRVDADHLARVSTCWDLNVVDFRSRLTAHGIDDDVVASLQEAIRESAYEHFVVTGMRRYLLNQDGGEDEYGEAAYGSDDDDFDDASSMATGLDGSVVSSPGSRSVMSSMTPAKRAKAEERRERRAARRAALRARIRAGNAAVDFRKFKVGSLRDQLERSGVDAGPLAMLVHSLAHAMRQGRPKKRGGFLGRLARNILRGSDSDDPVDAEEEMAKKKKKRNEKGQPRRRTTTTTTGSSAERAKPSARCSRRRSCPPRAASSAPRTAKGAAKGSARTNTKRRWDPKL